MGIKEDRDESNEAGLRGLLRRLMKEKDEAFIKILDGGWRGEEVPERPSPGTGPYLHYRRGYPVLEYANATTTDTKFQEFRVEI
jgi:hypothetical protein